MVYRQFIRTTLNYASMSWAPIASSSNIAKLQTIKNKALRIATGCLRPTQTDHLHDEAKVLKLSHHLDMSGTQFRVKTFDPIIHAISFPPPSTLVGTKSMTQ